ncbi:MAG: acetate uptake transporter [Acetobacteraceae bacterium]
MERKFGNAAPLGLIGFATTTWLLSMVNAGWFDAKSLSVVLAMALVYGGTTQALAGILSFVRGETFATVAFLSYGAFWISLVALFKLFGGGPEAMIGWYLIVWGIFTFYMWIATFRHNMALQLVFLTLWIAYLLLAIGSWGAGHAFTIAGGYVGLVCAAFAAYTSAAELINGDFGRTILPLGPFTRLASAPGTPSTRSAPLPS